MFLSRIPDIPINTAEVLWERSCIERISSLNRRLVIGGVIMRAGIVAALQASAPFSLLVESGSMALPFYSSRGAAMTIPGVTASNDEHLQLTAKRIDDD